MTCVEWASSQKLLTWLQILHSVSAHQLELVNSMEGYVESEVLSKLKPVEKCWQPADFLPEGNDPDYVDKVHLLPRTGVWCQLLASVFGAGEQIHAAAA